MWRPGCGHRELGARRGRDAPGSRSRQAGRLGWTERGACLGPPRMCLPAMRGEERDGNYGSSLDPLLPCACSSCAWGYARSMPGLVTPLAPSPCSPSPCRSESGSPFLPMPAPCAPCPLLARCLAWGRGRAEHKVCHTCHRCLRRRAWQCLGLSHSRYIAEVATSTPPVLHLPLSPWEPTTPLVALLAIFFLLAWQGILK